MPPPTNAITPPPPPPPPPPGMAKRTAKTFGSSTGTRAKAQRVGVYGEGGVGKTRLVAALVQAGVRAKWIDLEDGSNAVEVDRIEDVESYDDVLDALQQESLWTGFDAVVIDSVTRFEYLATKWTVENVETEKGEKVKNIEGYGFGKGYRHLYDQFYKLLPALDRHIRAGRHVILTAHANATNVVNPAGEDYAKFSPRLHHSDKSSIRSAFYEWLDHLLFVKLDVAVSKDGVAQGAGGRTIYTAPLPYHDAKSKTIAQSFIYTPAKAVEVWRAILPNAK